jgi:hypothetical protein
MPRFLLASLVIPDHDSRHITQFQNADRPTHQTNANSQQQRRVHSRGDCQEVRLFIGCGEESDDGRVVHSSWTAFRRDRGDVESIDSVGPIYDTQIIDHDWICAICRFVIRHGTIANEVVSSITDVSITDMQVQATGKEIAESRIGEVVEASPISREGDRSVRRVVHSVPTHRVRRGERSPAEGCGTITKEVHINRVGCRDDVERIVIVSYQIHIEAIVKQKDSGCRRRLHRGT